MGQILQLLEFALQGVAAFLRLGKAMGEGVGTGGSGILISVTPALPCPRRAAGGNGACPRTRDPFIELANALLQPGALRGCGLEACLLPAAPVLVRLQFPFQPGQPCDVEVAVAADEVREHMDFAEYLADEGRWARRMAHQRPVGAGNVAAVETLPPDRAKRLLARLPRKAPHAVLMAPVECLFEKPGGLVALTGEAHAPAVQGVIPRRARILLPGPDQQLAQLAGGQAGADDRAMKRRWDFPGAQPRRAGFRRAVFWQGGEGQGHGEGLRTGRCEAGQGRHAYPIRYIFLNITNGKTTSQEKSAGRGRTAFPIRGRGGDRICRSLRKRPQVRHPAPFAGRHRFGRARRRP